MFLVASLHTVLLPYRMPFPACLSIAQSASSTHFSVTSIHRNRKWKKIESLCNDIQKMQDRSSTELAQESVILLSTCWAYKKQLSWISLYTICITYADSWIPDDGIFVYSYNYSIITLSSVHRFYSVIADHARASKTNGIHAFKIFKSCSHRRIQLISVYLRR